VNGYTRKAFGLTSRAVSSRSRRIQGVCQRLRTTGGVRPDGV